MVLRSFQSREQSSAMSDRSMRGRSGIGSFDRNQAACSNVRGNIVALRHRGTTAPQRARNRASCQNSHGGELPKSQILPRCP
jgi:hypothetical protein